MRGELPISFGSKETAIVLDEIVHDGRPESQSRSRSLRLNKDGEEADKSGLLHQRTFQFKFTVEKLQGSLYRSDPNGKKPDALLVDLIAEHFFFDFLLRPFDMSAEVRLQSLAVGDHVDSNPSPEFRNIISSEIATGEQPVHEDDHGKQKKSSDLFRLKFTRVQKDSPEFKKKYNGIAMNIDTTISTINVIVTRKTLLTLLDFILITFTNPGADGASNKIKEIEDDTKPPEQGSPASQESDKININVRLSRIAMILNNDGIRLATLSLSTARAVIFLDNGKMKIAAHLGNLSLIDDVNQGVPETSPLRQLITIQGDELAPFHV